MWFSRLRRSPLLTTQQLFFSHFVELRQTLWWIWLLTTISVSCYSPSLRSQGFFSEKVETGWPVRVVKKTTLWEQSVHGALHLKQNRRSSFICPSLLPAKPFRADAPAGIPASLLSVLVNKIPTMTHDVECWKSTMIKGNGSALWSIRVNGSRLCFLLPPCMKQTSSCFRHQSWKGSCRAELLSRGQDVGNGTGRRPAGHSRRHVLSPEAKSSANRTPRASLVWKDFVKKLAPLIGGLKSRRWFCLFA